ncbi:MAG TPA: HAD-IIIA family hydrolase [Pseudomonadales bacterium]|nr:HAD-IIIA family hydrolase [Pseudomonadales bacterium]
MKFPQPILDKARAVRMLILDVDGVLTDGRLYYTEGGQESKAFSTQDGAAIKMLAASGVGVAIITGRQSAIVARRATELGVQHVYQGAGDKARALEDLVTRTGIDRPLIAHVGDDLPDLPLFNRVGMKFAVPGAHPEVIERADYVTRAPAGIGAVREVCHLLMVAQETWAAALARFDT